MNELHPNGMRVHVLGSGTSMGVPIIGCHCPVCTSSDPHNHRLRSSVALQVGERRLLIDCSIDFRAQMLRTPLPHIDAVLLTHTHSDHINGIDDLRVFNWRQRQALPLYSTQFFIDDLRMRFPYCFDPLQEGGGVPKLDLRPVRPGEPFLAAGIEVLPVEIMHGVLPILGFRIGDFAYLTDCSGLPPAAEEQLRGVDTLIISALRHTPHPTHFTVVQAMAAARRLGARRTWFTHIADELDHEATNKILPDGFALLHDGLTIEVHAPVAQPA